MSRRPAGLVVVGGSYAALHLVASARENGYEDSIAMVTAERWLPYDRPSLSKSFIVDPGISPDALAMRSTTFYERNAVIQHTDAVVADVDALRRRVRLADGSELPYDVLALATGSVARRVDLPGADLDGVLPLRSLDDAIALRERLAQVQSVVVVGAGFIGLEVASALAGTGRTVTVLESADEIMGRVLTPLVSGYLGQRHRAAGVRLKVGATVEELHGDRSSVRAVRTATGEVLDADLVLVAVGASPETRLAERAGALVEGGVVVDSQMRTSVPGVLAAGDCTAHPNPFRPGGHVRLESVQNAVDQGRIAGSTVAGGTVGYESVPWFWSDQCGIKLQMAGLRRPGLLEVVRGNPDEDRFSVLHLATDGTVIAVDSVNRPAEHMLARRLIRARIRLTPGSAADLDTDLKDLAATAA